MIRPELVPGNGSHAQLSPLVLPRAVRESHDYGSVVRARFQAPQAKSLFYFLPKFIMIIPARITTIPINCVVVIFSFNTKKLSKQTTT